MTTEFIFLILGFISMMIPAGITILMIVLPYIERKAAAKEAAAKEAAERAETRQREKDMVSLAHEVLISDFARDATAGQESTNYKDLLSRAKEKAMSME